MDTGFNTSESKVFINWAAGVCWIISVRSYGQTGKYLVYHPLKPDTYVSTAIVIQAKQVNEEQQAPDRKSVV